MKTCSKCKIQKPISEYSKNKQNKDGLQSRCKECHNQIRRIYAAKPHRVKAKREYYEKTIESKKVYDKIYRQKNAQKFAESKKRYEQRNKNKSWFKIERNIRRRIHHALKDNYKSDHTMNLLGCTIEQFIKHIESQFEKGMNWDNYGQYGWHIDHIKPCREFDLSDPEQQKLCFHYTNQRPLWAKDNLGRPRRYKDWNESDIEELIDF